MTDIERTGWTWYGNVDYHVALTKQILAESISLAANDKSHILWKLCIINTSSIIGGLNSDNGLAFWDNFAQISLFTEIPTDVVAAGGCSATHFAKAMLIFIAQKTDLASTNVVGQTNQGSYIVRGHQMISNKDWTRYPLIKPFRSKLAKQIVGFQISHSPSLLNDNFLRIGLCLRGNEQDIHA